MIVGLGIDLVENDRFEEELARGDWSSDDGIFVGSEIRHCKNLRRSSEWYASCFAAKEATLKAFDVSVADLTVFREVELRVGSDGVYEVYLHGQLKARCDRLMVRHIRVSIAQDARLTMASVVLDG